MRLVVNPGSTIAMMSPMAASMYLAGMPWYACVILGAVGIGAYSSGQYLMYRLASKAIDKAAPNRVPDLMTTLSSSLNGRNS